MSIEAYAKGTIKVVWITDTTDEIQSQMFETEAEAEALGKQKGNYLIFSLLKQKNMESFSWKLLPYGNYALYHKLIKLYFKHRDNNALMALFKNFG